MATPPFPIVPAEHLIVVAMRVHKYARMCEQVLSQAGFPVKVCPDGVTAADVIEAVETHHPHLLIIDDDIEWAEGVPVVLRLHADPAFAKLHVVMLLRQSIRRPSSLGHDLSPVNCFHLSKPFYSSALLDLVQHLFQSIASGKLPAVSFPTDTPQRTEADWDDWKHQLPPFALFEAAWEGDYPQIEKLIAQGVDLNARDWLKMTALHLATRRNRKRIIPLLLDAGAEINAIDGYGNTPLLRARPYIETMRILLERGADPNKLSHYHYHYHYETAVQYFVNFGQWEMHREWAEERIKLLLVFGADPNAVGRLGDTTPLQVARKHNLTTIERLLREYGAKE